MFTHSHTSSNILYQKMTHFDFLLRIGVRIGVRIARVVLRKKVLTPSSCRRRVATQMLPRKCCHANVATQMLPRKCCHANVATQMLPRKCCHANVARKCCQAVLNVATQLLPRKCCHAISTQMLPRNCCLAIVATQLLPPAPVVSSSCHRPPALSSPSGSHHQCRSSSLPTSILTGVLTVLTHAWAVR